jgi:coenzyme F420-0:L-glutamate ligase / coenzyme F420-1:gamma-L-glutamate ligase
MHTDLHTFLRSRRSIRSFKDESIPDSVVDRMLLTAIHAPSAHNLQPWRFVKIQDLAVKHKLGAVFTNKMRADLLTSGSEEIEIESRAKRSLIRLTEAPLVILLCRDIASVKGPAPEEHTMAIQSVALAGLQLLLAAHAEGLGGSWICWPLFASLETINALSLPESWQPQAMFFIGHPDEAPLRRESIPLEEIVLTR